MSVLHLMVPIFLAIEFVLVLVALLSAMLFADPQVALLANKSSRCERARFRAPARD
jgi:hypothetical protein